MKTLIRKAAIVLMIMSLMSTTAFAGHIQVLDNQAEPNMQVQLVGEDANDRIAMEIDKAIDKAADANTDAQMDALISNLLKKAAQISGVSIKKIERLGGDADCVTVPVEIGGQTIDVDPIRIVRLR